MASGLRIVFFGTPDFAAFILRELVKHGEHVAGVVTTPDRTQGRGLRSAPSAVRIAATELGLPVLTPEKHRDPVFLRALQEMNADVFIVVAYKILPREVYQLPRMGAFNIHASLLPKFRGAAPINWAIIRGERETGITTFLLADKVDTGNILRSKRLAIGPDETAGELHDRLMHLGAEVAIETLEGLSNGTLKPQAQTDATASDAPKIYQKDCAINLDHTAVQVHNFVRGMSPHPGATVRTPSGVQLKLLRTALSRIEVALLAPGQFDATSHAGRLFVGTATTPLEIIELQREGKRAMSVDEFLRGNYSIFDGTPNP